MGQTDSDLMTQVRDGREAALGELFERYHVPIFRFCLRMTGNRAVSEDLVQDIFMRMLKHRRSFRPNTTFTPWMYRIARNACVDHLRRSTKAPEPSDDLDAHLSDALGADERVSKKEQAGLIRRALLELPVERREVLLLSRYELKGYDEIARTLDITVSNVKIRVHRAIKQLRQVYRDLAQETDVMKCDEMTERLTDRLNDMLDEPGGRALDEHLARCADCREEAAAIERIWQRMGDFAEDVPSERMRTRFRGALSAYREGRRAGPLGRLQEALESVWPRRPAFQLALVAGALLVGLLLGGRFGAAGADPAGGTAPAELRALREAMQEEMQAMRRTVSLSLLEHQSASERLRGVDWGARAAPDERVVTALLSAVREDPSVNVRLAAIDALGPLVDRPRVGRELLATLDSDAPPIVRVSLAEVLLAGGVDGSAPAVERLLDDTDFAPAIRQHLQNMMRTSS